MLYFIFLQSLLYFAGVNTDFPKDLLSKKGDM